MEGNRQIVSLVCVWDFSRWEYASTILSAGRIPVERKVADPNHSCCNKVYLYEENCCEEGNGVPPPHMQGGGMLSNKSNKQTHDDNGYL